MIKGKLYKVVSLPSGLTWQNIGVSVGDTICFNYLSDIVDDIDHGSYYKASFKHLKSGQEIKLKVRGVESFGIGVFSGIKIIEEL